MQQFSISSSECKSSAKSHSLNKIFFSRNQIDILGNPVWDYTHQCDHVELREMLNNRRLETANASEDTKKGENIHRNVLIRIKCTLTSRGRSVNIKSASYKVNLNIIH